MARMTPVGLSAFASSAATSESGRVARAAPLSGAGDRDPGSGAPHPALHPRRAVRRARSRGAGESFVSDDTHITAFRTVPRTGVIYVTTEATKLGFSQKNPDWCNLGQGQPETGELPGAPPRVRASPSAVDDQEYAPVAGPAASCARRSPRSTTGSTARACRRSTAPENVSRLRRRARLAHPRGGGAGQREPRPLPPRLHGVRGAARRLQGLHADPDPARGRARLRLHPRGPAQGDPGARPVGAA